MTNNHQKIGFSLTQAIALPQEAWYLVGENIGKAELRVTLCILFNYFETGTEANPMTFNEIVEQTKMSKSSVLDGLNSAIARGSVFRKNIHNQPRYEPRFEKTEPMTCINHDTVVNNDCFSITNQDTCHGSEFSERERILHILVRFGIAYHVSYNIAMSNRYPLANLTTQILCIFHELKKGSVPKGRAFCGYVVNRIKFNRFPPVDFDRPMAIVEMFMAEKDQSRDDIFLAFYNGEVSSIDDLETHTDYLNWLNNAYQNGEIEHDTE